MKRAKNKPFRSECWYCGIWWFTL